MKFSVIIPVYNVEEYIAECIEMVLNQTYKYFELILVDDGSTDNSYYICNQYKEKDNRIKVIHKSNGGASSARNLGLDNAEGEYIIFIDSDDYWNGKDVLQNLSNIIDNGKPDIIVFRCLNWNLSTDKKVVDLPEYNFEIINKNDVEKSVHYLFSEKQLPGGPVSSTVKRSLIEKNSIRFIEGIKGEDYDWNFNLLLNAKSITATNDVNYVYRQSRKGSVTTTADLKSVKDLLFTVNKWNIESEKIENVEIKSDIKNYLAHIYSTALVICNRLNANEKKEAICLLKEYRFILKYGYWKRLKLINIFASLVGIKNTVWLLDKLFRFKRR